MNADDDHIAKNAHELWEAEGRPHGRSQQHWDQAKEIIALHESAGAALLPRDTGATTPVEEKRIAIDNEGEFPNLTDTGDHDLTSIDREPAITAPPKPKSAAKQASRGTDPTQTSDAIVAPRKASRGKAKAKR